MYKLFSCDINLITEEEYEQELNKIPLLRRRRILSQKELDDRKRSLAAEVLTARAVTEFTGGSQPPEIAFGEYGKPYCVNYNVHFNAAHSGRYTVVAVSGQPIGVDIEEIRPFSATAAFKILTDVEKDYIMSDEIEKNRQRRFFELWCAKEAYLKLTGEGRSSHIKDLPLRCEKGRLISEKNIDINIDRSISDAVIAVVQFKKQDK